MSWLQTDSSESGKYLKRLESPETEECMRAILGVKSRATLCKRASKAFKLIAFAESRKSKLFPLSGHHRGSFLN